MTQARTLRRFLASPSALIGAIMIALLLLLALAAPLFAPYDPAQDRDLINRLKPPTLEHPLGTDELGRDILNRIWHGTAISLEVGLIAVALALLLGSGLGLLAGFFGGRLDLLITWLMDILLAFPSVLLAIAIVAVLGPGIINTMLAVGIVQIPIFARLVRAQVLSLRGLEYIQAEEALGVGRGRILLRHILPATFPILIVQSTLSIGTAILDAAALGFLGLGALPPAPEWGLMISRGFGYFTAAPWISLFPGLAIMAAVVGFNLLGDGLRDALDVRGR